MSIQSSIFAIFIGLFIEKEKKWAFFPWFLGVSDEATTEKENEKEQSKPTTDCRHTHKISPWSGGLMIFFYDFLARRENMLWYLEKATNCIKTNAIVREYNMAAIHWQNYHQTVLQFFFLISCC